ncbi:MAG: type II toxin-antitoxin system HicA family toxin [Candidatus Sulfotelmatobacter sp.]
MSNWPSCKANRVYKALLKIGWTLVRQAGSHAILSHPQHSERDTWAFHDSEEIGPRMLAKIGKKTGLRPEDLIESGHSEHMWHAQIAGR